jgi:hypothetical protein
MCKGKLGHFHVSDNDRRYPGTAMLILACASTRSTISATQRRWASNTGPIRTADGRALGLEHIKQFLRD